MASEGYSLFGRASARQNFEEKFDLKNLMVTSPSGLVRSGGGGVRKLSPRENFEI